MILWLFVVILIAHWFGDFVLQTDWMATNKSKSIVALFAHVTVYTIVLVFASVSIFGQSWPLLIFPAINGIFHFATDFVTSKITAYLWKKERRHDFFVMIGLDQLIHAITLAATLSWLKG